MLLLGRWIRLKCPGRSHCNAVLGACVLGTTFHACPADKGRHQWIRESSAERPAPDPGQALSRRKIFKGAVGVAAAGAAGGAVLTEVLASPAPAAAAARPWSRGRWRRRSSKLTDAATIAVDASLGNDFRVTIAGNRTMGNPSNPTDGQKIIFQVTQGTGGRSRSPGAAPTSSPPACRSRPSARGGADRPARLHLQRDQGQMAARRVRDRVHLASRHDRHARAVTAAHARSDQRHLPAVPVHQRAGQPGFLQRAVHGRRLFEVTTGGCWFDGYWWWVCPSGQSTSPQKFALWCGLQHRQSGADRYSRSPPGP